MLNNIHPFISESLIILLPLMLMNACFVVLSPDLQLAAELGKILLERNKEVEAQILQLQNIASQKDEQIAVSKLEDAIHF